MRKFQFLRVTDVDLVRYNGTVMKNKTYIVGTVPKSTKNRRKEKKI